MPSNFRRRQAARAALPLWLMLTMPVLFLALTFGVGLTIARQAARLHEALHPRVPPLFAPESAVTATQVVLVAASFLTGALLAMPLGNILLWLIPPPARQVLEANATISGDTFRVAIRTFWGPGKYMLAGVAAILALCIWAPWLP